jgi:hypothetical protein
MVVATCWLSGRGKQFGDVEHEGSTVQFDVRNEN